MVNSEVEKTLIFLIEIKIKISFKF